MIILDLGQLKSVKVPPSTAQQMRSARSDFPYEGSLTAEAQGFLTAIVTKIKQIPPCIYVVNLHNEPVTVVVSKHRPNRLLSGVQVNASITGGGLSFTSAAYTGPASKKTLAAKGTVDSSKGEFPLFDRHEDFGVISIFKGDGPEKVLYIENDRVPMGATAYFENKPDLRIRRFK